MWAPVSRPKFDNVHQDAALFGIGVTEREHVLQRVTFLNILFAGELDVYDIQGQESGLLHNKRMQSRQVSET